MTSTDRPADSAYNPADGAPAPSHPPAASKSPDHPSASAELRKSSQRKRPKDRSSRKDPYTGRPARVRIRTQPKQQPDQQLQDFLGQATTVDPAQVREAFRRQAAGHWHDIVPAEETIDPTLLDDQLRSMAQQPVFEDDGWNWNWRRDWLGLLASLLFHLIVLGLLLIWIQPQTTGLGPLTLQGVEDDPALDQASTELQIQSAQADALNHQDLVNLNQPNPIPDSIEVKNEILPIEPLSSLGAMAATMSAVRNPDGGGLTGRATDQRAQLVTKGGGNEDSERAVDWGLQWIAKHQRPDGSWRFTHPEGCTCNNPGHNPTETAATGLALLAFLGRNHNHVHSSPYQETVLRGLNFLVKEGRKSGNGDLTMLTEASMYGQGIASLALAEAYAISKDPALKQPTQQAIDFIVEAQHPLGGWRYMPGQIGDLNVTVWQMLALKTAKLAGLEVPDRTLQRAKSFVDSQATSLGYQFTYPGYDPTIGLPVPSAIGILLRMYEGWGPGRDEIKYGVQYLLEQNVSTEHIYFNYYTTMVMFHYGGESWKSWNTRMRDFLINTQSLQGHSHGSWYFEHPKTGQEGGRLFNTCMAVLILEVYYRHLRLYEDDAFQLDFPLD